MSNEATKNVVRGYKVFNPDWTCDPRGNTKQYTCPGKFEEDVELEVCGRGMHFCERLIDCFNYYVFNPCNKVAEVIAYGDVVTDGTKSCTNKLEIVRELSWEEVLCLVNTGKYNTGFENTGDRNAGDYNAGDYNTGHYNAGDRNSGLHNTGDYNTGSYNTGSYNIGRCNIGYYNTSVGNIGDRNTGICNTGNCNTGNKNIGNSNTGDWNKSSFNTGCFNVKEHKIMLFDKESNMTYREWLESKAMRLLQQIPKEIVKWVPKAKMTDEEKALHPTYEITGGYLKEIDDSECGQIWWDDLPEQDKNVIRAIPNFDADIFYECTGIMVE